MQNLLGDQLPVTIENHGGRSRTRTYDLSHVRLSFTAKFKQTRLENPKQPTSSAVESLPGLQTFASFTRAKHGTVEISQASSD